MGLDLGSIQVELKSFATSVNSPSAKYDGLQPGTTALPKGFQQKEGCRPIQTPTIFERDITIPMRDGVKLRADVFRPAETDEKVPILLAWSPYGKSGTGSFDVDIVPFRAGIPQSRVSNFQSFEGPDPAEWITHGYAVVNVDIRGVYGSEGDFRWHGSLEGEDGYDTIEYLGQLPWTNGRVVLMGNSWLATSQWFIAATRPPHLAAIMPLEGLSDIYRETACRGGVPWTPFWAFLRDSLPGEKNQEDVPAMIEKYPLMNKYWDDKRAQVHLINVPAYVLGSYSTDLHTVGSIRGYEDIPHDDKWLRIHSTQEWHDLYREDSTQDFKKFLDFYTKDIKNDWKQTPRVRVSVLRFNQDPIKNIPFPSWPVPNTELRILYLSEGGQLAQDEKALVKNASTSYQSDVPAAQLGNDLEELQFSFTFEEKTTIIGPSKAVLYFSCKDHDDLDIFVQLRKADKNGNLLEVANMPLKDLGVNSTEEINHLNLMIYYGPQGILRASHRKLDTVLSKPHWAAHDHTHETRVSKGEIVKLEIGIWPTGIQFEAGEQLIFKVAGHTMVLAEFAPLRGKFSSGNKGRHELHFGSEFASYLEIPIVHV